MEYRAALPLLNDPMTAWWELETKYRAADLPSLLNMIAECLNLTSPSPNPTSALALSSNTTWAVSSVISQTEVLAGPARLSLRRPGYSSSVLPDLNNVSRVETEGEDLTNQVAVMSQSSAMVVSATTSLLVHTLTLPVAGIPKARILHHPRQ